MTKPVKKKIIIALSVVLGLSLIFVLASKKKKPTAPASGPGRKVYTSGTNVNLRTGPGTDGGVVQNIKTEGTLLGVAIDTQPDSLGGELHWVKIQPDPMLGVNDAFYVREDLLKL